MKAVFLCHGCGKPAELVFENHQFIGTACCKAMAQTSGCPFVVQRQRRLI